MPRFLYPLLPYRSFFAPFLILSAITISCWVITRLYVRRNQEGRASFRRELLLLVTVVYLSGLAAATLTPGRSTRWRSEGFQLRVDRASLTCSSASLPQGSTAHSFCVRNARGNFLLFIPLGFLLPLVWRRLRFGTALAIAVALSLSIEMLQYVSQRWGVNRTADINDVVLNSLGALLGLALVSLLRRGAGKSPMLPTHGAARSHS